MTYLSMSLVFSFGVFLGSASLFFYQSEKKMEYEDTITSLELSLQRVMNENHSLREELSQLKVGKIEEQLDKKYPTGMEWS